jgi:thiol-disulfide isomerase/thioredoxin
MINLSTAVAFALGLVLGPILVILVLVLLFVRFGRKGSSKSQLSPPELPGKVVSLDFTVRSLDDEQVNLEELRGGKPMFLNFWATWCGPCVQEMPSIEKLYHDLGDGIAFACVSNQDQEDLEAFLEENPYSMPIYRIDERPAELQTPGIPATLILSRSREVVLQHVGAADWSDPSVIQFIQKLQRRLPGGPGGECRDGVCPTET